MPIFRSIRLYSLYTTAYGVQHLRSRCVILCTVCKFVSDSRIQTYTGCKRLHTGSIIQRIQPNTPEDGYIDARNMYSYI